jgi:hypothetical protein
VKAALVDTRVQGPVVIRLVGAAREHRPWSRGDRKWARLRDAYVGPYTSIGPDVQLEGAEVEHSIVLSDASTATSAATSSPVWSVPGRESIRDFRLPKAPRLNIGEGAKIRSPDARLIQFHTPGRKLGKRLGSPP